MTSNPVVFQSSLEDPYPVEIKGESYHRSEIEAILPFPPGDEGIEWDDLTAHLVLDPSNPRDPNAVKVLIDSAHVGYLSREDAVQYRSELQRLGIPNAVGQCTASIRGGHFLRSGNQADYGIRLDLDLNYLTPERTVTVGAHTVRTDSKPPAPKKVTKIHTLLSAYRRLPKAIKWLLWIIIFFIVAFILGS